MTNNGVGKSEDSSKVCYNHTTPVVYPSEYDVCPACGFEKITRLSLGQD